MDEIILFDNYDPCERFDEVKQEYVDENLSESQIWEIVSVWEREEWDSAINFLKSKIEGKVLAKGTIGTWRGNFEGINIFDQIETAIYSIIKDCDYIKIWSDNRGHLYIKASHHDGTHLLELRKVTDKGERIYRDWEYSIGKFQVYTDFELYNMLWNKHGRLPHIKWL